MTLTATGAQRRAMVDGSALSTDDWCTPQWLADLLGPFDLDPCSNARSHIRATRSCVLPVDGLAEDWGDDSVFCNPPYSTVMPWAQKLTEHLGPWVALVKLDPSTRWWAELMRSSPTVAPFRRRLRFEGDKAMTANFPSALVYAGWRPSAALAEYLWLRRWT